MKNLFIGLALACAVAGCATEKQVIGEFRFVNWNIGHYGNGEAEVSPIPEADGPAQAAKFAAFIAGFDADVFGISEYSENFTTNGSIKASKALFRGYNKVVGEQSGNICNALFFKRYPVLERKTKAFNDRFEDTYYLAVKLDVNGTPIWFVQTHLDSHIYLEGHSKDRANQMLQLIEDFKDEPRVVISGDFSVGIRIPGGNCFPAPEEYKVFEDAGYELVNVNGTGTYPCENPSQPVDNVIVKGLGIGEVHFTAPIGLSDHLSVFCSLRIYGK